MQYHNLYYVHKAFKDLIEGNSNSYNEYTCKICTSPLRALTISTDLKY